MEEIYKTMFPGYPDVVDVEQLCKMLDVCHKTGYRLLKSGAIQHIKVGRTYRIPKVNVIDYCIGIPKDTIV